MNKWHIISIAVPLTIFLLVGALGGQFKATLIGIVIVPIIVLFIALFSWWGSFCSKKIQEEELKKSK